MSAALELERRGKEGSDFSPPVQGSCSEVGGGQLWRSVWWRGQKGQRKREDKNPAEAANLHGGMKPVSSY